MPIAESRYCADDWAADECGKELRSHRLVPVPVVTNEWTATVNRLIHLLAQLPLIQWFSEASQALRAIGHYPGQWLV